MNPEFNIQEEFIELKLFDVVFSLDVFLRLNIIMDEIALELSGSEKKTSFNCLFRSKKC